jgi:endonuclease/exonuclease/phosphatase (EEP) superfamily protein YafD
LRTAATTVLALGALVHPLAGLVAGWDWRADMLTHFQAPALLASLLTIAALVRRHRLWALAFGLLAITQIEPLIRYDGANPVPAKAPPREMLRVLMANVYAENFNYDSLTQLIQRERPDVVGMVEVTPEWLMGLEQTGVRAEFPYRRELPLGTRGLALWFRQRPSSISDGEVLCAGGNPVLRATLDFAGRSLQLWLVHPPNPLLDREACNPDLAALATRLADEGGTQLVVGDLNRTEGSPFFTDFVRVSGLRDSRYGFGSQPSWPTFLPYRIAIDHAFVSADLAISDRRLGPEIGSDHFPLIVDVAPASAAVRKSATQSRHASP